MNKISLVMLISTLLLLAGCQTPQPEIVVKYVAVTPPDSLLVDCNTSPPPDIDKYLSTTNWSDKEQMLVESYNNQTSNIGLCNIQMKNIRKWKYEQLKLYSDKQKE